MAATQRVSLATEELADLLASVPSPEQLLEYRPSARALQRARELLAKSKAGRITTDEEWELDQFEHAEALVQLIKARLRSRKVTAR
jgi:hypothetical protein